jgi:hypothetical protein
MRKVEDRGLHENVIEEFERRVIFGEFAGARCRARLSSAKPSRSFEPGLCPVLRAGNVLVKTILFDVALDTVTKASATYTAVLALTLWSEAKSRDSPITAKLGCFVWSG